MPAFLSLRYILVLAFGTAFILTTVSGMLQVHGDIPPKQEPVTELSDYAKLFNKLHGLVIKKIKFENVSLANAMSLLTEESKKADPDHQGIKFVVHLPSKTKASLPTAVTFEFENVPLELVLSTIMEKTNLQYDVEDDYVYIRSASEPPLMTVKTFPMPDVLLHYFRIKQGIGGDAKENLANMGIHFSAGSTATYLPKQKSLVVRNTPEQLDLLNDMLKQCTNLELKHNTNQIPTGGLVPTTGRAAAVDVTPALKVIIEIPQSCDLKGHPDRLGLVNNPQNVITCTEAHFHVLIENISSKPVYLWAESNSEGCRTLSLEITMANGKKIRLCNEEDSWTENCIAIEQLNPGESQVREIYYATPSAYLAIVHHPKPPWHSWFTFPFPGPDETVTVQAFFEQMPGTYPGCLLWSGKVASEPRHVELSSTNFIQ